ncbi:MAG: hypothetical protein WCT54_03545 [Patescibacteria group bacterium]|jgi:uncharacterized membrane protein YraQ (UPF0718 family)
MKLRTLGNALQLTSILIMSITCSMMLISVSIDSQFLARWFTATVFRAGNLIALLMYVAYIVIKNQTDHSEREDVFERVKREMSEKMKGG